MDKQNNYLDFLSEIVRTKQFAHLDELEQTAEWGRLSQQEKQLAALLFVLRGEAELGKGSARAYDSFRLAEALAPDHYESFYWQGMSWFKQAMRSGRGEKELLASCEKLERAVSIRPDMADAWYGWAQALTQLGVLHQGVGYFQEANQKFGACEALWQEDRERLAQLFWTWGNHWFKSSHFSGEVIDCRYAVDKFKAAERLGLNSSAFWLDYGNALSAMGGMMGQKELFYQALALYWKAVELSSTDFQGWFRLGCTLKRLYEISAEEKHFSQAQHCFEKAAIADAECPELWWAWGKLHLEAAQWTPGHKQIEFALEKFKKAELLDPHASVESSAVIQALIQMGAMTDQLDLLRQAQQMINECLERNPAIPDIWCRYGECLNEFGHYFEEEGYFIDAVDKFRTALSIDSDYAPAWHGLYLATFAVAEMRRDEIYFEKAAGYCARALAIDSSLVFAWNDWGMALMKMAEITDEKPYAEQAIEKYEQAIALRGGLDGNPEADWLYNYGCALDFLGTFVNEEAAHRQAVEVLSRALFFQPDDLLIRFHLAVAWFHLGEVLLDLDCYYRALGHFEQIVRRDPEEEVVWDEWGIVLLSLSDLIDDPAHTQEALRFREAAETKFLRAVTLGSSSALYHLSWLYSLSEQFELAMHFIRRAAAAGSLPPFEDLIHEEWLEELHATDEFRDFLNEFHTNE